MFALACTFAAFCASNEPPPAPAENQRRYVLVSLDTWFDTEISGTREIVSLNVDMSVRECLDLREAMLERPHPSKRRYHCDEAASWH